MATSVSYTVPKTMIAQTARGLNNSTSLSQAACCRTTEFLRAGLSSKTAITTKKMKNQRPNVALCVATSAEVEISLEERKKSQDDEAQDKIFRLTEVEASAPLDFNAATVLEITEVSPGVRNITVEAEVSREFVKLEHAYSKAGQKVEVRIPDSGETFLVLPSSAPLPSNSNRSVLLKARGDIPAGSTKLAQYGLSVKAPLELYVTEASAPALFNMEKGAEIELGPFQGGPDYRPIMFLTRFTTILVFASGSGIATARALIEAKDVGTLNFDLREEVRLYYSAPTPSALAYKHLWSNWENSSVKVRPTVDSVDGESWDGFVGTFSELFDADDLEYDPDTTAAVVFGSKEANDGVMKLLEEAGLPEKSIVRTDL